ncbi:MAG: heavy metal translocating P-type ATPase [Promethearchaeota archaeon Loki_b31]|nr:MAG: heavy metal translocating P-type ATPase [Candidatus Lokiarchaeota archaeon Loki_b31]
MVSHITQCTKTLCLDEGFEVEKESFFEKRFWYFIIPSLILLGLSITLELLTDSVLLSQVLAVASILLSGYGILKEAIEDVLSKKITANILMIVAGIASFFILHGQEGAMAILLYAIAEYLEELTTEKSKNAIKELLELAPDDALLKIKDSYEKVPTETVKIGEVIGIKPGMKAPLDGIIVKGKSYFDESAITGESLPIFKEENDEIFAASINNDSFVDIKVIRESSNTVVAKIAESIKLAQQNKSDSERFIEKFAKYYTPIILISALFVMIIPTVLFNLDFNVWFYRGLILLVVSCPCALTLSTPLANIAALTKLAKEGILVKGNKFIEIAKNIELIAFDKTGTLTEGNLKVFNIINHSSNKQEILKIAASLENLSEHPIGKAIVYQANQMQLLLYAVEDFKITKGKGIRGVIQGEVYYIGSKNYLEELKFDLPDDIFEETELSGTIPILLGNNKTIMGIITIRDVLRVSAPLLVDGLKKRGYKSVLISGDNQLVCNTIGECLDIDSYYGELLPDQKLEEIESFKKKFKGVAMVGDGINDAPALALSDLGIAIGASATDLTLETADVIIMSDDLKKIITFFDISKKTNKIIRQNIWTSIIVKVTFAILTVLGFMTLWLAVGIADMGVSLLVLINGMTIFRYKIKFKELSLEYLESNAKLIICQICETKNIIPQHHGRDMIEKEGKLICWRKLLSNEDLEPCQEELPLFCPKCNNELHVI